MSERVRYTVQDVQNDEFYKMPKWLFEGEFINLSNNARVLYSLLKDRHKLSVENRWINKKNEVYLIYSRENMRGMLGLSDKPTKKVVDELVKYRLIDEERHGQGRPNLIFLLAVTVENQKNRNKSDSRNGENSDFKDVETPILGAEELRPNHTNGNHTNGNQNKNQSINQTEGQMDDINSILTTVSASLEMLKIEYPYDKELIDELDMNIREMCVLKSITVKGKEIPQNMVIYSLKKLTSWHLSGVLNEYKKRSPRTQIENHKSYIQSMIYNIPFDQNFRAKNEADMSHYNNIE